MCELIRRFLVHLNGVFTLHVLVFYFVPMILSFRANEGKKAKKSRKPLQNAHFEKSDFPQKNVIEAHQQHREDENAA